MFDAACYWTQIMSTKFHTSCFFLQLFNFISIGSNDGFTLQKKFASKGEHMFIYPLEATPHNIWNHLFFFLFFFFFFNSKIFLWLSQKENNNSAQFLFWIHSDIIGPQCNVAGIYTNQDEII